MMKQTLWLCLFLSVCVQAYASNEYYCFANGKKSILLVSPQYQKTQTIKYYPYLKDIKLSEPVYIEEVEMGEVAQPEVYKTMNELIDGKVTGQYTFVSQGYILYGVSYRNLKTKKETHFEQVSLNLTGISCL
ncbi:MULTISPECIES: hypothetical protein [Acinetobacter]|uniref:Uncharacterized protein n=2 Tax=Acinetobacter higginsii TaxID=70347 RepID=N9S0C0_9GAMM|nr:MULTISPECIES: hypothetical protein [Acinetobacter]ENX55508.1 hypothetical protein F902_03578 [Acinetobacter higginsii]ENX63623.1 hypothetical protein F885_00367 [Acinetobacter higginsii]MCH7318643.1 hypothetical protein [Acinetobacter higginsii]MCI3879794.1 hypothetical protein [Acinetobacter higginsii]